MKAGISLAFIGPNKLLQRKTPPSIFPGIRCFRGGGASAEHSRYRTERSSAFLAGWKSPPGKGQPPSRTESWVRGGAAGRRRTRRAKRRQGVPWAVGAARARRSTSPSGGIGYLHNGFAGRASEYNRGTGCRKTARPGLCWGRRLTGVPTVKGNNKRASQWTRQSSARFLLFWGHSWADRQQLQPHGLLKGTKVDENWSALKLGSGNSSIHNSLRRVPNSRLMH